MAPWIIPAALGGLDFLGGLFGSKQQQSSNMSIAKYQNDFNYRMWQENNAYNTPAAQMQRYKDAGLNPALMYGQGSPGNSSSPVQSADIKPADVASAYRIAPIANQTAMTMAQIDALKAQTRQTGIVSELKTLELQVMKRNPLLDDGAFGAIIESLKSTASIKASEARTAAVGAETAEAAKGWTVQKLMHEVNLLEQQFKLGEADLKIKAEVLNGKAFQNAILEVQKKFLADGDVGPAQIYQFIQLLLMKAL